MKNTEPNRTMDSLHTTIPKWITTAILLLTITLFSCETENEISTEDTSVELSDNSTSAYGAELIKDSIFYYTKEIYLWYDQLPTYDEFTPRIYSSYSEFLDNLNEEIYELTQYAIDPETGESYEYLEGYDGYAKYSFIEETEESSSGIAAKQAVSYLSGTDDDFGFALTAIAADDIRIRYVTNGSTAYDAGIRRGDQLIKVNGEEVTADNEYDVNLIVNTFDESTYPLTVLKSDGRELDVTLYKSTYTINPVFKDTIISTTSGNVGYLAFDMFTALSNAEGPLEEVFGAFANSNIRDLVLDLRYNGGGYITTADYMINNIIPSTYNNQTMYTEQFNDLMKSGEATILENQPLLDSDGNKISFNGRYANYNDVDYSESANTYNFEKLGSLNSIENLYVITTGTTASASELVFNTLSPYLNVILIGSTSYGKPVGFFPVTIDAYDLYVPNFKIINSDGAGDYFSGFDPDYEVEDDVTKDFGDPDEECFAQALSLIDGSYNSGRIASSNTRSDFNRLQIENKEKFNGMIDVRKRIDPK